MQSRSVRATALKCIIWQFLSVALAAIITLTIVGSKAGFSVLVGGVTCVVPCLYFTHRFFRYQGARAAPKVVRSWYTGEIVKWLLTAVLFVISIKCLAVGVVPLIGGFIVAQIAFWLIPAVVIARIKTV